MSEHHAAAKAQEEHNKGNENSEGFDFPSEFDRLINAQGKITSELLTAANRYFLYFSFFESLLLGCNGGQGKSSAYAEKLLKMNVVDLGILNTTYSVFSERYSSHRDRYESLCGGKENTPQKVQDKYFSTMQEKSTAPQTQLELCLFVCFRLRNNLFHGPKWRYFLNDQEELLLEAGNFIHSILHRAKNPNGWTFVNILELTE
ncbi:hypothetical protein ABZT81_000557 [Salmonella enterica]